MPWIRVSAHRSSHCSRCACASSRRSKRSPLSGVRWAWPTPDSTLPFRSGSRTRHATPRRRSAGARRERAGSMTGRRYRRGPRPLSGCRGPRHEQRPRVGERRARGARPRSSYSTERSAGVRTSDCSPAQKQTAAFVGTCRSQDGEPWDLRRSRLAPPRPAPSRSRHVPRAFACPVASRRTA